MKLQITWVNINVYLTIFNEKNKNDIYTYIYNSLYILKKYNVTNFLY